MDSIFGLPMTGVMFALLILFVGCLLVVGWVAWLALHPSKPKTRAALAMHCSTVKRRKNPDIDRHFGGAGSSVE